MRWFESYLSNRHQKIVKQNQCSTLNPINIGVPQGSILGPTLFIMFVNDLFNVINHDKSKMIMYADDTVVYTSAKTIDEGFTTLENNLHSIINWCNNNRLTLNVGKTKHMVISPSLKDNLAVFNNLQYESIVSLVSRRYMRVVNGSLVVCLSEYLGLPVVCEVNGVVTMKPIDMYILHDSSVGVCFVNKVQVYIIGNHHFASLFPPSMLIQIGKQNVEIKYI